MFELEELMELQLKIVGKLGKFVNNIKDINKLKEVEVVIDGTIKTLGGN